MKKLKYALAAVAVMSALLTGCGGKASDADSSSDPAQAQQSKSSSNSSTKGAKPPKQVLPEIDFTRVNWFFGSPRRELTGGVWLYTKEQHPGEIGGSTDWETRDLVQVQVSDSDLRDYSMSVHALQVLDDNVVRILVKLTPPEEGEELNDLMPRTWFTVERGALDGKSFIVESLDGRQLSID